MRKLCWCSCIDCNRMAFRIRTHQMRLFAMEFSCLICALCQLQMGLIIANNRMVSFNTKYIYSINPILCKRLASSCMWLVTLTGEHIWWWTYQSNGTIIVPPQNRTRFSTIWTVHAVPSFSRICEQSCLHSAPIKCIRFNWFSVCSWVQFNCCATHYVTTKTIGCHDLNFKFKFSLNSVGSNALELPQSTFVKDALKLIYSWAQRGHEWKWIFEDIEILIFTPSNSVVRNEFNFWKFSRPSSFILKSAEPTLHTSNSMTFVSLSPKVIRLTY